MTTEIRYDLKHHFSDALKQVHKLPKIEAESFIIGSAPYTIEALISALAINNSRVTHTPMRVITYGAGLPIILLLMAGYSIDELTQKMTSGEINFAEKICGGSTEKSFLRRNIQAPGVRSNKSTKEFAEYIITLIRKRMYERACIRTSVEPKEKPTEADFTIPATMKFSEFFNHPDAVGFDNSAAAVRTFYKELFFVTLNTFDNKLHHIPLTRHTAYSVSDLIRCAMGMPPWTRPHRLDNSRKQVTPDVKLDDHYVVYPACRYDIGAYAMSEKLIDDVKSYHITIKPESDSLITIPTPKKWDADFFCRSLSECNFLLDQLMYEQPQTAMANVISFHGKTIGDITI